MLLAEMVILVFFLFFLQDGDFKKLNVSRTGAPSPKMAATQAQMLSDELVFCFHHVEPCSPIFSLATGDHKKLCP